MTLDKWWNSLDEETKYEIFNCEFCHVDHDKKHEL